MINVPTENYKMVCTVNDFGDFIISDGSGWRVTEISGSSPAATARDIADALNRMKIVGFNQGLAHVRAALGIVK